MKDLNLKFCWDDYIDYCLITGKKASHYNTLKDFKEFCLWVNKAVKKLNFF